jgi:polysaccharide export outer membrane protein
VKTLTPIIVRRGCCAAWLAISVTAAAVDAARPQEAPSGPYMAEYTIGPEDVLEIAVWSNEDISRTVPVRPDGRISLPLLDDVRAAGLTPVQLRDVLVKALASYMPTPIVSVIVREIHSFKVTVIGEVTTPGRYELRSRTTVLDVLAMAGGLSQYADREHIVVIRRDGTGVRELPYDFNRVPARDGARTAAQPNFWVEPDDIILVP